MPESIDWLALELNRNKPQATAKAEAATAPATAFQGELAVTIEGGISVAVGHDPWAAPGTEQIRLAVAPMSSIWLEVERIDELIKLLAAARDDLIARRAARR